MTPRQWRLIACIFLILATWAVYGEVRHHQFIQLDDGAYVLENPRVSGGLTSSGIVHAFTTLHAGYWIPLTWLSHMVDCQLFGLSPGGHHLTNLLFHIANSLLLFLWLNRATRALGPSFLVAALLALHPLHVESVAWVAERKDVLSTFFWLLTMWAYLRYAELPVGGRYLLVLICFSLGLMAKPMLVTLPLALLLLDFWPLGRQGVAVKRLVLEKAPLLVLSALFGLVTIYAQREAGALAGLGELPLAARVATALAAYAWYPLKMFWPSHLAVLYPEPLEAIPLWQALGAGLILALVSLGVARQSRRRPYLPVGWLWYLGTLFPVIGLVQVGDQVWADRFTYVPLIGLFIMAAWGGRDLTASWPGVRVLRAAGAAIVLAALGICTLLQVQLWRDSETLFAHTLRVTGDNPVIHHNLGVALAVQGRREEAGPHFLEALRLNPNNARGQNRLGEELFNQGKIEEALARFKRAVKRKPDFPGAYNNLGRVYAHQGKMDRAMAMFQKAIGLDPNFAAAYKNWGLALATQGKKQEAMERLGRAVELDPDNGEARRILQDLKTQGLD